MLTEHIYEEKRNTLHMMEDYKNGKHKAFSLLKSKSLQKSQQPVITPQCSLKFWPFPLAVVGWLHPALLFAGLLRVLCCSCCCILLSPSGCFWWQFPDFQSQFLNYSAILPQLFSIVSTSISGLASTELRTHYFQVLLILPSALSSACPLETTRSISWQTLN